MKRAFDLDRCPSVVIWEATQSCDLVCLHCLVNAQPKRHPLELETAEAEKLIREVADFHPQIFIITGGDPLKRFDIYHLVEYAIKQGLRVAIAPGTTPLLTKTAIAELKKVGLSRLALSLDGSDPERHDTFRGVPGSYARTLQAIQWANECHLPIQMNTMIPRRNLRDLENIAHLMKDLRVGLWRLFFLVPGDREQMNDLPYASEFENVFAKLYQWSEEFSFKIKTAEAPHFRRYVIQQRQKNTADGAENGTSGQLPTNDGKGSVFVSHTGEVCPGEFLPISAGNVRQRSLADIYRKSELFKALRNSANLRGRCGECEYKQICGGSRARAYAVAGDIFSQEPCCSVNPRLKSLQRDVALQPMHA